MSKKSTKILTQNNIANLTQKPPKKQAPTNKNPHNLEEEEVQTLG